MNDDVDKNTPKQEETPMADVEQESTPAVTILSEKRKALFEPLEPANINGRRPTAESLLPPPDFDEASYPRGWLVGKKRKLVNVDVVESMRRIAVQEMNRKVLFNISFTIKFMLIDFVKRELMCSENLYDLIMHVYEMTTLTHFNMYVLVSVCQGRNNNALHRENMFAG